MATRAPSFFCSKPRREAPISNPLVLLSVFPFILAASLPQGRRNRHRRRQHPLPLFPVEGRKKMSSFALSSLHFLLWFLFQKLILPLYENNSKQTLAHF